MPEPVWYYARGDVERGPFTIVQIKALANAGKLRRDDLVWKEGMENWTAAEGIRELFPAGPSPAESAPVNGAPVTEDAAAARSIPGELAPRSGEEIERLIHAAGRGCLFVGLLCAVLSRGCESLGERRVSRLEAAAKLQAVEQWQRQREPIAASLESLQNKEKLTPADQDRLKELTQTLNQLDASRGAEELSAAQRLGVNRSAAEFRAGAFMRGATFHGGVVFLLLGGFALASTGAGSDRWFGIGIVLVVAYSALSWAVPS
jgi:hypothetical protein